MAQDQKQDAIIEAAIKRFAHYGVNKTTMNEIAADLNISKASLYYYFPDKLHLFGAVLQHLSETSYQQNRAKIDREADPFAAIRLFLEQRTDFIIKYHNILEYLKSFKQAQMPPVLQPIFQDLRKRELQKLVGIIEKGTATGKFHIRNTKATAELFFDFLEGYRLSQLWNPSNIFPEKKEFQSLLKKELAFAEIFLRGLTIS